MCPLRHISNQDSPRQLDSAAVLKRLALDDEVLGRSRAGSFAALTDYEGSYRDEGSNEYTVARPTHEQLRTRHRSLSAPPLHPDIFPSVQHAWSAAPDIDLNISATATTMQVLSRPNSVADPYMSPPPAMYSPNISTHDQSHLGGRFPSDLPRSDGESFGRQAVRRRTLQADDYSPPERRLQDEMSVRARSHLTSQDFSAGYTRPLSVASSRDQLCREEFGQEPLNGVQGRFEEDDRGNRTPRQSARPMSGDHWRAQSHSRASSPYELHASSFALSYASGGTHAEPKLHSGLASYRFGREGSANSESELGVASSSGLEHRVSERRRE
ncbi:hypothetical protein DFH11DRAFT_882761 [Phellopilus nigrolimitatus]|nr:hypothetical protein DFH11DRAFT_882761 [Phellopilus nigrolimitatus]